MSKKVTTEQFIERAKKIHGDKYDYSESEYVKGDVKTQIICKAHGPFLQRPSNHMSGNGCPDCGNLKISEKLSISLGEVLRKFKAIHGDRYDYSEFVYSGSESPSTIICGTHGPFTQQPNNHISGNGCPDCGRLTSADSRRKTRSDMIREFVDTHGDKYDYSKMEHKISGRKVRIICKRHGEFLQNYQAHRLGQGCPTCGSEHVGRSKRLDTDTFISRSKQAHDGKYDYSESVYISSVDKIKIKCIKHGFFHQLPSAHFNGQGCPTCSNEQRGLNKRLSADEFSARASIIHRSQYDYSKTIYLTSNDKLEIFCRTCRRSFWQHPHSHLNGRGCPRCNSSKGESFIRELLENIDIEFVEQKTFPGCKSIRRLKFDFFLPGLNSCIEFQGKQHYQTLHNGFFGGEKELKIRQHRDQIKRDYCIANDIDLIEVPYWIEDIDSFLLPILSKKTPSELHHKRFVQLPLLNV